MAEGPSWVQLTRTVGEINARLIAGDLENEGIPTHMEMEPAAWFYGAEDPNRLATIYVRAEDLQRAEEVLAETSTESDAETAVEFDEADDPYTEGEPEFAYPIVAEQDRGLRSRPLRWAIAAVIVAALVFGFLQGTVFDIFD